MPDPILPTWAVTICAVGLATGTAGLGVWLGTHGLKELVKLVRRTLAAEARIQHRWMQRDRETLNYWIRDSYRWNAEAARARRSAKQEKYMRNQIAKGASNVR